MSLLSEKDKREIRDAVRMVTDTFMVSPLIYCIAGGSLDRWSEDNHQRRYYGIELEALKEGKNKGIEQVLQGNDSDTEVKLTMNLEYLAEKGLITADYEPKFKDTTDFFVLNGKEYKVTKVYADGPLDQKDVLVIVEGTLREWTNQLDNTQMVLTAETL